MDGRPRLAEQLSGVQTPIRIGTLFAHKRIRALDTGITVPWIPPINRGDQNPRRNSEPEALPVTPLSPDPPGPSHGDLVTDKLDVNPLKKPGGLPTVRKPARDPDPYHIPTKTPQTFNLHHNRPIAIPPRRVRIPLLSLRLTTVYHLFPYRHCLNPRSPSCRPSTRRLANSIPSRNPGIPVMPSHKRPAISLVEHIRAQWSYFTRISSGISRRS